MLLWRMILALLISDFILQFNWIIEHKKQMKGISLHGLIYLIVSLLLVVDFIKLKIAVLIFIVVVIHICTDLLKEDLSMKAKSYNWLWFLLDQAIHLMTIILGVTLVSNADFEFINQLKSTMNVDVIIKYIILLIINLLAGKYFTNYVIQNYQTDKKEINDNSHAVIGIFERFLITLSVLVCRYEIIGFLIAAKSIIRLPEAKSLDAQSDEKSRQMVNFYLIGTFASYSWAIAFSVLFVKVFM